MKKRQRSRKGAPGIVEVAQRCGVSPATVSRFFNSPEMVRPETRSAIEKATADLGYIRDRAAGAMHSRYSGTFGLVVPTINNAIFSELIDAFANRLRTHNRTMLIASHNYNLELEVSSIRSLLERRIDGVAIVGQDHLDSVIDMLRMREVPMVALWGYQLHSSVPFIGVDNAEAAGKVTQHLLDLGHHDIAFLFPDTENNDRARERKNGALSTMAKHGIAVPENRILFCPYNIAASKTIALELVASNKPSAVVCGNDIIAHGVIYAALERGLTLPRDLSIVGIGDFAGSAEIFPGLTTVRMPANQIGKLAADSLVEMSSVHSTFGFKNQIIETHLIVRESTCAYRSVGDN